MKFGGTREVEVNEKKDELQMLPKFQEWLLKKALL